MEHTSNDFQLLIIDRLKGTDLLNKWDISQIFYEYRALSPAGPTYIQIRFKSKPLNMHLIDSYLHYINDQMNELFGSSFLHCQASIGDINGFWILIRDISNQLSWEKIK